MYENMMNILTQVLSHALSLIANNLVPLAEGAASAEATGIVPMSTVYVTLVVLAALTVLTGVTLLMLKTGYKLRD